MFTYLIILSFIFQPPKEDFCSCRQVEKINLEEIKDYDLILKGVVKKITTVNSQKLITVHIISIYKGNPDSDIVTISTPVESSMCGLNIGSGREWLMYAYGTSGDYSTNSCSRSGDLDSYMDHVKERIKNDLAFLENLSED